MPARIIDHMFQSGPRPKDTTVADRDPRGSLLTYPILVNAGL